MITRREYFTMMAAVIASTIMMGADGCQSRLISLTRALGSAIANLAAALGHSDWADKLRHDTDVIVAAVERWKEGTSAADILRLLNDLIRDIKLLEVLEPYRPLVVFALGTAASLIDFFNRNGGGNVQPDTPIRLTLPPHDAHEFNHDWDAIRAGSPGMQKAPIL